MAVLVVAGGSCKQAAAGGAVGGVEQAVRHDLCRAKILDGTPRSYKLVYRYVYVVQYTSVPSAAELAFRRARNDNIE